MDLNFLELIFAGDRTWYSSVILGILKPSLTKPSAGFSKTAESDQEADLEGQAPHVLRCPQNSSQMDDTSCHASQRVVLPVSHP